MSGSGTWRMVAPPIDTKHFGVELDLLEGVLAKRRGEL